MIPAVAEFIAAQGLAVAPESLSRVWTEKFFLLLDDCGEGRSRFRTIRDITTEALEGTFAKLATPGDVAGGVDVWFEHVKRAPLYPEVREAVERLAERFELAIVSDTDDDVFAPALRRANLPVELVFTSSSARAYKIAPGGELFRRAFEALGVAPAEVAHVGDSASDVVGAVRAGARAVWLSRKGQDWTDPRAEPAFVARDLLEAADMLAGASRPVSGPGSCLPDGTNSRPSGAGIDAGRALV